MQHWRLVKFSRIDFEFVIPVRRARTKADENGNHTVRKTNGQTKKKLIKESNIKQTIIHRSLGETTHQYRGVHEFDFRRSHENLLFFLA